MSDAREEKESMVGWTNDGRDDQFDQGHASRVRVDVGWVAFCGARRLSRFPSSDRWLSTARVVG
jgi:hypothetical protein